MKTQFSRTVKWKVSLSNGETFYEGKTPFELFEGELPPWKRLLEYISQNKLEITSLSLYTDKGQTFNLPSSGNNPKFRAFADLPKATYTYFRVMGQDVLGANKEQEIFVIAEAQYNNYSLQLWVSENNPQNSWVLVKDGSNSIS